MRRHMIAAGVLLVLRGPSTACDEKLSRPDGPYAQPAADSQQHSAGDLRHDRLGGAAGVHELSHVRWAKSVRSDGPPSGRRIRQPRRGDEPCKAGRHSRHSRRPGKQLPHSQAGRPYRHRRHSDASRKYAPHSGPDTCHQALDRTGCTQRLARLVLTGDARDDSPRRDSVAAWPRSRGEDVLL